MGHNTKTMNRNAAVQDVRSKTHQIAKATEALAENMIHRDEHVNSELLELRCRVNDLEAQLSEAVAKINFMQLPIWKRLVIHWRGKQ